MFTVGGCSEYDNGMKNGLSLFTVGGCNEYDNGIKHQKNIILSLSLDY